MLKYKPDGTVYTTVDVEKSFTMPKFIIHPRNGYWNIRYRNSKSIVKLIILKDRYGNGRSRDIAPGTRSTLQTIYKQPGKEVKYILIIGVDTLDSSKGEMGQAP